MAKRYFLFASESVLTLVSLDDPSLSATAVRALRAAAAHHPASFAEPRGTLVDGDVRVERGTVFFANEKITDLAHIVESVPQAEVLELSLPSHRDHHVAKSVGIGAGAGLRAGIVIGGAHDCSHCDDRGLATMVGAMWYRSEPELEPS